MGVFSLGGLSRVGISSRSTRPWNGQPPSIELHWTTTHNILLNDNRPQHMTRYCTKAQKAHTKFGIRSSRCEIRNTKFGIRNSKYEKHQPSSQSEPVLHRYCDLISLVRIFSRVSISSSLSTYCSFLKRYFEFTEHIRS